MSYLNNGFDDDYGDDEENPYEDYIENSEPNEEQKMAQLLDAYVKSSLDAYNCTEANREYVTGDEGDLAIRVTGYDGVNIRGFWFTPDWDMEYWKCENISW